MKAENYKAGDEVTNANKGYTQILNEILETLARAGLNGTQRSILDVIFRQTYGYQRNDHSLSVSFIANATTINTRQIKRELNSLIEKNIVIVTSEATFNRTRKLRINEDCARWLISDLVTKKTPQDKKDTQPGDYLDTQIKKKENIKERDFKSVFDYYLSLNLIKHRAYTKDMVKAIAKAINDNKYSIEYCKVLLERHKIVVDKTKDTDFPVKVRGFSEFFGQKVYGATHLICSEYEEGGKYYEQYIRETHISTKEDKDGIGNEESVIKPPLKLVIYDSYEEYEKAQGIVRE